jgi:Spy/CpxP family protein refolding chaperone
MTLLKNFSKLLGLIAAGSLIATSAYAMSKDEMFKSLNLTDAQKTEVQNIMEESRTEREKIMQSTETNEMKMESMRQLHTRTEDKLAKTLSPEQMAKLEDMQQKMLE